jgi:hypothetical protein
VNKLDKKDLKKLEAYMEDPRTQAKAVFILQQIHEQKRDDVESLAITLMVLETIKKLPKEKK